MSDLKTKREPLRGSRKGIPAIIHQIWKNEEIPYEWRDFAESWKRLNPGWAYRLWTDDSARELVRKKYPGLLEIYDAFSYDIQRADLARYLILHCCGGVYADLDMECLQDISSLLAGRSFVVCYEPQKHAREVKVERMVCNAFMASVPGHQLLGEIIKAMATTTPSINLHSEVLASTGPLMLTRILNDYTQNDVDIFDAGVACPFENNSPGLKALLENKNSAVIREKLISKGTYAVHYWSNSWVRNLGGDLINPRPHGIEGYRFYAGWDSFGYDIKNGRRHIQKLAEECDCIASAVGFNTDGFIKYRLRFRLWWTKIVAENGNQGLYVKKSCLPLFRYYFFMYLLTAKSWLEQLLKKTLRPL